MNRDQNVALSLSVKEKCLHARVNRVTNDSVGVNIFEGAEMEFDSIGLLLGDIGVSDPPLTGFDFGMGGSAQMNCCLDAGSSW